MSFPLRLWYVRMHFGNSLMCRGKEEQPWPDTKRKPKRKRYSCILTPQKPRPTAPPTTDAATKSSRLEVSPQLQHLQRKHNLTRYQHIFLEYELTEAELLQWDLPSLMVLLKSPAPATRSFLADLKAQARDRGVKRHATVTYHITTGYSCMLCM